MLYTKNGCYPQESTDGTDGWVEVIDKPEAPLGKEVVWWCPPGWVVRTPQPADDPEGEWTWEQPTGRWILHHYGEPIRYVNAIDPADQVVSSVSLLDTSQITTLSTADIPALTTGQISSL